MAPYSKCKLRSTPSATITHNRILNMTDTKAPKVKKTFWSTPRIGRHDTISNQ